MGKTNNDTPRDDKGTYLRVQVDREMLQHLLRRSSRNEETMSKYVGRLIRLDMADNPKLPFE